MKRTVHLLRRACGLLVALVALPVLMSGQALAQASNNVDIRYEGGDLVVDFAGAAWRTEVETIVLLACADTDNCTERERIAAPAGHNFRRSGAGLYRLEFRRSSTWWLPAYGEVLWEQFVANFAPPSAALIAAAQRHAPLFSFHARESYFPVSLETLFGQPIESFDALGAGSTAVRLNLTCTTGSIVCASAGTTAANFMARNGHLGLRLFLRPEVARSEALRGSATDFPVYWFAQTNGAGTTAWVTYAVFYAYDDKRPEYVDWSRSEGAGDHAIDRESVTVRFSLSGGAWQPVDVIYASHLPTQPNTFKGCADPPACTRVGTLSPTWTDGRTRLPWDRAAKRGHRPIVYVADGSHAVEPAFGWYFLNVTGWGAPFNVTEPAGSSATASLRSGRLVALDLNDPAHAALKFSGTIINALGPTNYRIFPFVRYPIDLWANVAGTEMAACASGDCAPYIHNLPVATEVTPASAIVGEATTFTVRGENLAPMLVDASNCAGLTLTASSAEELRFQCTPVAAGAVNLTLRRTAAGEVLETRSVAAVSDTRDVVLAEAGGWSLEMRITGVPKPGGVGRFNFGRFSCGGTLRYAGVLSATGEHVFQEDHESGSCVKDCAIHVASDLRGYREVCPSPPYNGGTAHSGSFGAHGYTATQMVGAVRRAEGTTVWGLTESMVDNIFVYPPVTGADFKAGVPAFALGTWSIGLRMGIIDYDGIRVHFHVPSQCRALEIVFATRESSGIGFVYFRDGTMTASSTYTDPPLPTMVGSYMLALRRLSASTLGWTLHDTASSLLLNSGTVPSSGMAPDILNGQITLLGYRGGCAIQKVRVTDWSDTTWF